MSGPRLGLITLGHGPRTDLLDHHRTVMRLLGIEGLEIRACHALEGVADDEIAPGPSLGPTVACHLRSSGAGDPRLGTGYRTVMVGRDALVPHLRRCLEALEREAVDAAIVCSSHPFPDGSLRSEIPLVLPHLAAVERVAALARSLPHALRLALVVPTPKHVAQDVGSWRAGPWPRPPEIAVEALAGGDIREVAARLRRAMLRPDIAVLSGYGLGIAPNDPPGMTAALRDAIGTPVMTSRGAACLAARAYLGPPLP